MSTAAGAWGQEIVARTSGFTLVSSQHRFQSRGILPDSRAESDPFWVNRPNDCVNRSSCPRANR
jgi:hypothetical protein